MNTKLCRKCGQEKPAEAFGNRKLNRDGLKSWCRACENEANRTYAANNPDKTTQRNQRYYQNNREQEQERAHTYYESHREQLCEYSRIYGSEHREERREYNHTYYLERKEQENERTRQWKKDNNYCQSPSKLNAHHRRRALKANAAGSHTTEEWVLLCEQYGQCCLACGARGQLTRDHVVPLSQGGSNDIQNIQPLCVSCNSSKRDKIIDYRKGTGGEEIPRHPDY